MLRVFLPIFPLEMKLESAQSCSLQILCQFYLDNLQLQIFIECFRGRLRGGHNFTSFLWFRGRHGGVEKRGGRKTSRMTPLQKRGFGPPPPRTVCFPPPSGVSALLFPYKNPRQSRTEALLEGSKNFRESAFSGTFPTPIRFAPPHMTAQVVLRTPFSCTKNFMLSLT